jgi:hypothetical protein
MSELRSCYTDIIPSLGSFSHVRVMFNSHKNKEAVIEVLPFREQKYPRKVTDISAGLPIWGFLKKLRVILSVLKANKFRSDVHSLSD